MNIKAILKKADLTEPEIIIVTNILDSLGFKRNLKGFNYIRYAIVESINNPSILNRVTKEMYPRIAEEFKDTSSKVERAIRHAIEMAVKTPEGDPYFRGNKLTNSEFIEFIADEIRIRREK